MVVLRSVLMTEPPCILFPLGVRQPLRGHLAVGTRVLRPHHRRRQWDALRGRHSFDHRGYSIPGPVLLEQIRQVVVPMLRSKGTITGANQLELEYPGVVGLDTAGVVHQSSRGSSGREVLSSLD